MTVSVLRVADQERDPHPVLDRQLYLDGRQHAESRLPACFPVEGGTIEVKMSNFGIKRCHYVTDDGAEYQLSPDRYSAEGRRANVEHAHPGLSRGIGLLSTIVLVAALAILIPQLIEQLTRPEAVAQHTGRFTSPIDLPAWGNTVVGVATVVASTERALRMRYHWLLDGAAGGPARPGPARPATHGPAKPRRLGARRPAGAGRRHPPVWR